MSSPAITSAASSQWDLSHDVIAEPRPRVSAPRASEKSLPPVADLRCRSVYNSAATRNARYAVRPVMTAANTEMGTYGALEKKRLVCKKRHTHHDNGRKEQCRFKKGNADCQNVCRKEVPVVHFGQE